MSDVATVDVALATYNGARFLPAFLDSVAAQDWPNVAIVASDDGSSDGTQDILAAFPRTKNISCNPRSGIVTNFDNALAHTTAPYVALADQDDVWRVDKLTLMMAAMRQAEQRRAGPVMVFSDLALVDEQLQTLHDSFFDATDKNREAKDLADFVLGNHIPGCAMLINRALVDLALPIPAESRMHDWWIALVAAGFGQVVHVDQPLIQYRQHQSNNMGAPVRKRGILNKMSGLQRRFLGYRDAARDARSLVGMFRDRYADRLSTVNQQSLGTMMEGNMVARFRLLRAARVGSGRVARTALQVLFHF